MDVGVLRASVRETQFAVHGVPATVTVPDGEPVETRIIWYSTGQEPSPQGTQLQYQDQRRGMAIRRDDVPQVPRETVIEVTEPNREHPVAWRVDSIEGVYPEHTRVLVVVEEVS